LQFKLKKLQKLQLKQLKQHKWLNIILNLNHNQYHEPALQFNKHLLPQLKLKGASPFLLEM